MIVKSKDYQHINKTNKIRKSTYQNNFRVKPSFRVFYGIKHTKDLFKKPIFTHCILLTTSSKSYLCHCLEPLTRIQRTIEDARGATESLLYFLYGNEIDRYKKIRHSKVLLFEFSKVQILTCSKYKLHLQLPLRLSTNNREFCINITFTSSEMKDLFLVKRLCF